MQARPLRLVALGTSPHEERQARWADVRSTNLVRKKQLVQARPLRLVALGTSPHEERQARWAEVRDTNLLR